MTHERIRIEKIRALRMPGFEYDDYGQGESKTREQALKTLEACRNTKRKGSQKYLTPADKDAARKRILLSLQRLTIDASGSVFMEYPTPSSQDAFWGLKDIGFRGYKRKAR